jgi:hypothetical protein
MSRWGVSSILAILGLLLLFCGLQVPAHLRAVDGIALQRTGKGTPPLIDTGLALVKSNQLGAAQLFAIAAGNAWIKNSHKLGEAVDNLARQQPTLEISGSIESGRGGALFESSFTTLKTGPGPATNRAQPFTEFIVRLDNRTKALELLRSSPNPLAQALLQFRSITNTVLFPPSSSASGQAIDTAISIGGLLSEARHISPAFRKEILALAADANTDNPQPLEQVLMDLMSLGQRFNWGQLSMFVAPINDAETLRILANLVQRGDSVPVIYSAVCLTGNASGVAKYLTHFSETGLNDLRLSLDSNAGGVNELLRRDQRLCDSKFCGRLAALASSGILFGFVVNHAPHEPKLALAVKWILFLLGGFFIAAAFHYARRITPLERPLEVRGFHVAREFLFASGFLLMMLLLSEPFLAQGSQKTPLPFRIQLPTVGSIIPAKTAGAPITIMNQESFLTVLLFFVLQALLYVASLVKLAEVRRQRVSAQVKLKLLKNEEHLFDAGLYLGFLGTIISLILVSLGVVKQPSLMVAYSSCSFGIIFVVFFKVVHLRKTCRHLLMEAETAPATRISPSVEANQSLPL